MVDKVLQRITLNNKKKRKGKQKKKIEHIQVSVPQREDKYQSNPFEDDISVPCTTTEMNPTFSGVI